MRSICAVVVCFCSFSLFAEEEKAVNDPQFHKTLLEIAACYERFGRVDDEARWAPWLCRSPGPSVARTSAAKANGDHSGKLYFLFASKNFDYLNQTESEMDYGAGAERLKANKQTQVSHERLEKEEKEWIARVADRQKEPSEIVQKLFVVVKESWVPRVVQKDEAIFTISKPAALTSADEKAINSTHSIGHQDLAKYSRDHVLPYATKGEDLYTIGERAPLFVMYRTEKNTPGTDNGWVYGTLTPDGKTVTSAGRVASCMQCHTEAPYPKEPKGEGRLFGLPEKVKKKEN